jgi:hypothetical protein
LLSVQALRVSIHHQPAPQSRARVDSPADNGKVAIDDLIGRIGGSGSDAIVAHGGHTYVATPFEVVSLRSADILVGMQDVVEARIPLPQMPRAMDAAEGYLFALMPTEGLSVIDVHAVDQPKLLDTIPMLDNAVDIRVAGSYAFVVHGNSSMAIVDLTEKDRGKIVAVYQSTLSRVEALDVVGGQTVLTGVGGIETVDVSEPEQPRRLGQLDFGAAGIDVVTINRRAIVAAGNMGIITVDLTDPVTPRVLATIEVDVGYAWISALKLAGEVLYATNAQQNRLLVVDASGADAPRLTVEVEVPRVTGPLEVVDGVALMVAGDLTGLHAIDTRDGMEPRVILEGLSLRDDDWQALEVVTHESRILVVSNAGARVYDVSNDGQINKAGDLPEVSARTRTRASVFGDLAFVVAAGNLHIVDMGRNPPVRVGELEEGCSGAYERVTGLDTGVALSCARTLTVVEIDDAGSPTIAWQDRVSDASVTCLGSAESIIFACTETRPREGPRKNKFRVYDASDVGSVELVREIELDGRPEDIAIANGVAYILFDNRVLYLDVADERNPRVMGEDDLAGVMSRISVVGDQVILYGGSVLSVMEIHGPGILHQLRTMHFPDVVRGASISRGQLYVANARHGLTVWQTDRNDGPNVSYLPAALRAE